MSTPPRPLRSLMAIFALALNGSAGPAAAAPTGQTVDYEYDGADVGKPDWGWHGRAYLPLAVTSDAAVPRPLIVFLHGVNSDHVPHFWMGGGGQADVREWIDEIVAAGLIEAPVLAAPSTDRSCTLPQALFTGFDLDRFLARTLRAVRDAATIDLSRVILVGHSGAGCNLKGGLITALRASIAPAAALVVDVCMDPYEAPGYARAQASTDLVVTWQSSWQRDVRGFQRRLLEDSDARGNRGLRLVEELAAEPPTPHVMILRRSLEKWLPRWIPPTRPAG